MASGIPPEGDPLVATLPPATDYMTYLTLLEYQLTPQNLPTLSRLLSDDDGTLAKEIGWDLLKLVLRFLGDAPDEANKCLEIIARRGNPREVVVRVAEELEKLGDGEDDDEPASDQEGDDEDELPTFAGEAPRVHLGAMTLDGMPPVKAKAADTETAPAAVEPVAEPATPVVPSPANRALKLQSLFNMLGVLHPRIKTQYPSRFLATSLPAALGAYRHVPITTATTLSFLAVLEQLAGKTRPPLPPRASETQVPLAAAATLPDPEAKTEEAEKGDGGNVPSPDEKAIIVRLLHAVLLEILDEYLSSLSDDEFPCMSWTSHLREKLEPEKHLRVPRKEAEGPSDLQARESVLAKVQKISLDLGCEVSAEIKRLVHADDVDDESGLEAEAEEEPSEYPTSPSQIPLPQNGVIFLYAYQSYLDATGSSTSNPGASLLSIPAIAQLIDHASPLSATPAIPSAALLDSLLSLLYRQAQALQAPTPTSTTTTTALPSPAKFLLLLSTLTQLFSITPWASLRDSAHRVASMLLHAYPNGSVRLQVIAQTIEGSTLSSNWAEFEEDPNPQPGIDEETGLARSTSALEPHPIPLAPPQQLGVLKAVGVDWLKDEVASFLGARRIQGAAAPEAGAVTLEQGLDPALITSTLHEAEIKGNESALLDLLFPKGLPSLSNTTEQQEELDNTLPDFLLHIPFYISTLNLLSIVLAPSPSPSALPPQDATPASSHSEAFASRVAAHVRSLGASLGVLTSLLSAASSSDAAAGDVEGSAYLLESRADVFALTDAYERVRVILGQ